MGRIVGSMLLSSFLAAVVLLISRTIASPDATLDLALSVPPALSLSLPDGAQQLHMADGITCVAIAEDKVVSEECDANSPSQSFSYDQQTRRLMHQPSGQCLRGALPTA